MKKLTLLAAAALSCCSLSTAFGQVQILQSTGPFAAPRLVSDQTTLDDLITTPATGANELESEERQPIVNPFDYFAEHTPANTPQVVVGNSSSQLPSNDETLSDEGLTSTAPATSDVEAFLPAPLPSDGHPHHQRSVVDTIVDHAALGNTPHVAYTPIYWGGAPQTPNPVANWLLREECVAGLWDGYPQQRAAECAHMWAHLSGHCGHHGHAGCAAGSCNSCAAPRNRYLATPSSVSEACGTCNGL